MDDLHAFWGDTLLPVAVTEIIARLLPQDTVAFLTHNGLPTLSKFRDAQVALLTRVDAPLTESVISSMYPRPEFRYQGFEVIRIAGVEYVVIGREHHAHIALKAGSGEVFVLNGERPPELPAELPFEPIIYVNVSIECYLRFLAMMTSTPFGDY